METFVVRLWEPAEKFEVEAQRAPVLHGTVEHVRRMEARPFKDDNELLDLLRAGLEPAREPRLRRRGPICP